jgi:DNA-binding NarL/FixJ family response regulator
MPRVLIAFTYPRFFEQLRKAFESERDFAVFGDAKNGVEAITRWLKLYPNLVILQTELPLESVFEAAKALKRVLPEIPLFLITEKYDAREEKEALSHGIDAVFEKNDEFKSIVMNARAACGPQ